MSYELVGHHQYKSNAVFTVYMTDMNDCCLSYLESSGIGMWCLPPVVYGCYGYNGFTYITIVHVELM